MIRLNIHEAKTHLSRYLKRLMQGETILLCKRNTPIAEIHPIQTARKKKRPTGLVKGRFQVPQDFFESLPDEILRAFQGKGK